MSGLRLGRDSRVARRRIDSTTLFQPANALAVTPLGVVYATGNFTEAGGAPANYIAYWDGAGWRSLGNGLNAIGYALALQGTDLYVGGDFYKAGDVTSSLLWHGQTSHRGCGSSWVPAVSV